MTLAVTRYEPTANELDAEARVFEREGGAEQGPLHALLVERIRLKILIQEHLRLLDGVKAVAASI